MASGCIWQQHASLFRRLYLEENKTLKEVRSEVEGIHGFPSNSLSTYETKLRDLLGLRKNLNPEGWVAIGQHIRDRRSPNWEVYFNGRKMVKRKVKKEIARYTKRRSYPAKLPMPPGAEIKWLDVSPQLAALRLSGLDLDVPRNEDLDMIDFDSTVLPRSPSDVLQETQLLRYNTPAIINPTVDIAVAANKVISAHFSAAILDPRLADLWHPILEDGPFNSLSRTLHRFFPGKTAFPHSNSILPVSRNNPTQNVDTWTLSSSSLEANQHEVSRRSHAFEDAEHTQALPSSGTISARLDPLRILALLIYYLSNNFAGLHQTRDTLLFLMEQVPHNLVGEFLQAESFAIEASWMTLAEWSFDLNKKHFFEKVMQVSLRCPEWVELHGARCLIFAAYFGCTKIARKIISCGVSPNEMSRFEVPLDDNNSSPNFSSLAVNEGYLHMGLDRESRRERQYTVKTFPLMEAAARGNLEILETLKNAEADCQLRSFGLTAAGYALIAHENGVMDDDVLSSVLSLLFDMGESLDAPMWQNDKEFRPIYGSKLEALWSEETLLDAMYLKRDSEALFQEMQKRSQVPYGVMTVSGILRSAADGCNALRDYMANIRYPIGLPRQRIEEIALARSFELPQAFESMMKHGFSVEFKALQNTVNIGGDCTHLSLPGPTSENILDWLSLNQNKLSASVVQKILDRLMEDQTNDSMVATRIYRTIRAILPILRPDQIRRFGTICLEEFCKNSAVKEIQLCLEAGVDRQAVDLLKVEIDRWDDTSIHQLLYDHGCRLILPLNPLEHKQLRLRYSTSELQWLITHGLSEVLNGMSVHNIITQLVSDSAYNHKVYSFAEWLSDRGYPLYTQPPSTSIFQQCELCESSPSLALLIYLGSNEDYVSRLLDQGLGINSQRCRRRNECSVDHPKLSRWYDMSPLEAAVRDCNISMVQLLLRRGADIHCQIDESWTILDVSVDLYLNAYNSGLARWKELITILLENGAKPRHKLSQALSRAIASPEPDLQLIRMLLENGADTGEDFSDLLRHVLKNPIPDWQLIQVFLENGADPKHNSSGLLRYAATSRSPNLQLIQMLLENGANANVDYYGHPLLRTVLLSTEINLELKMAIFALLLAHGAKYNSSEELVYACMYSDIELVRFHLNKGANPNAWIKQERNVWRDERFQNPLGASAQKGNVPIALVLLAAGATLSGRDRSLSVAAENGRMDMVALLLPHEKRLKAVNEALECALEGRYYSIIRLLRQRLAAANQED